MPTIASATQQWPDNSGRRYRKATSRAVAAGYSLLRMQQRVIELAVLMPPPNARAGGRALSA